MLHILLWLAFNACDSQPAANADETTKSDLADEQAGHKQDKKALLVASHEIYNTATDKEPWLNLRQGQSKDSAILAQMLDGTRVAVLEQAKWWKVQVTHGASVGAMGWAHPKWIRELKHSEHTLQARVDGSVSKNMPPTLSFTTLSAPSPFLSILGRVKAAQVILGAKV